VAAWLVPVGPDIPAPVAAVLKSYETALRGLQQPQAPTPLYAVDAAGLPPAADWAGHMVWVSDLPTLAYSDGSGWIRADTGATI
jgi:hypothetical protein